MSLREALVQSKNVPTVRLAQEVGHPRIRELATAAGISTPMPDHPSAALGTASVSLLELVSAYTAFANLGVRVQPRFVLRVERADGTPLLESRPRRERVLDAVAAYLTVDVLRDALERGTGAAARLPGRAAAGKTGTSDGGVDAWFVGFTPTRVAGVWVGFDTPRPIAAQASGGRVAAPIWAEVLRRAGGPRSDWQRPPGVVERPVDPRTGFPVGPGCPDGEALPTDLFAAAHLPPERCPGEGPPPVQVAAAPDEEELARGIGADATAAGRSAPVPTPTPTPVRMAARPPEPPPAPARTPAPAAERERAETAPPAERAADFGGWWTMTTEVAESSVARFEGLELGYRIHLQQDGDRVSGTGEKWSEEGARLPRARRTPITLSGTVEGDRLRLVFTERGARRESSGTLTLRRQGRGLVGTFRSDAASSSGGATLQPLP